MPDIHAIIQYYVRRNLRLRARGIRVPSFRESVFSESRFDKKTKGKENPEIKLLVASGKAKWVTIKGAKVCIENSSNKIIAGPDGFIGKTPSSAFGIKWGKEPAPEEQEAAEKDNPEDKAEGDNNATPGGEKDKSENPDAEKQAMLKKILDAVSSKEKTSEELRKDRRERGKITGQRLADIQKNLTFSETGENASCGGFRETSDRDFLKAHKDKHGAEPDFENMTDDEYEAAAVNLLQMPCTGSIIGGLKKETFDGAEVTAVIRFDKESGLFAKGYPGGFVLTFMKAKYFVDKMANGQKTREYNPNWKEEGYKYFLREFGKTKGSARDEEGNNG